MANLLPGEGHAETETALLVKNPALVVIRCNSDEIMVRMGSRSRVSKQIKDDGKRGLLAETVERFAVPQSVSSVKGDLDNVENEDLTEIVEFLRDNGVLVDVTSAEPAFLSLGLGLGDSSGLATRRVGIVGSDRTAISVAEHLADAGVRQFSLLADDTGEVGAAIARADQGAEIDTLEGDAGEAALVDVFEASDLVLALSGELDMSQAYACNSSALELGTPWILAYADGLSLIIGPLFRPFDTACFNCFDTQEEAGRTLLMEHLYYKSQLMAGGFEARPLPRFAADLMASLVALGAVQALGGRASALDGTVLRYDLERLEVIRESVLRLPRCPACVAGNPDYRHPFL